MQSDTRNRLRKAALALAIFLLFTVGYPVAVDQGWLRYSPYVLPVVLLATFLLCVVSFLHSDFAFKHIGGFVLKRGVPMALSVFVVFGGLAGIGVACGYYWILSVSKTHIAALLAHDKPREGENRTPQPNGPAKTDSSESTSPPVNPELAKQILEKLDDLKKNRGEEAKSQAPFLISTGPALVSNRRENSMFVVSFVELPTQSPVGPIEVELANLALFAGVLNQQPVPTVIQGYKIEIKKKSGGWKKLERIDTIGKRIYWTVEGHRFTSLEGNDIFDRVIYHHSFKSGDSALGWLLFRYPPDLGEVKRGEYKFRMTVYDSAGKKTMTNLFINGDDAQGAGLNFGPVIEIAKGQILRPKA